jgi:hypothetical protein
VCLDSPGHDGVKPWSDWIASLAMAICLVAIFAIVNVRLRLSLLSREAKQLSQDVLRLTMWAEERRLSQLDSATKKTAKHKLRLT